MTDPFKINSPTCISFSGGKPSGATFRSDRPSYSQMAAFAEDQIDMFDPKEEGIACFCGD